MDSQRSQLNCGASPGHYPDTFQGYEKYGIVVKRNGDIEYREWAPNAVTAHLIGDFSKYHQIMESFVVNSRA